MSRLAELTTWIPGPPPTFQAELRDYQLEGYRWLRRLSEWGGGACLADDMGLGKTVQALALILSRAETGPALVVAPTSVCHNWQQEAARFTPTLNVLMFGSGDRRGVLQNLGPRDLVICSYGLLQTESEQWADVHFGVICLDEAQAIKNPQTKRARAAFRLHGDFRMVTTGTPVENHVLELWSIFRFINPGLLGSRQRFMEGIGVPVEKYSDEGARKCLRRLTRPFVLRRSKAQVLTELPPRTDIEVMVQLQGRERATYEALRREALARIERLQGTPGQTQIQILAEITKLRLACCNARLVLADSKAASAKLTAFSDIVDELRENCHRALVFSQFVKHLTLIREFLDAHHIPYQYLDGSTATPERARRVDAFQRGEGDLFLISLKAGGTGLNLTAADYVIHMDPWWNPAVEDQASDRAHRIGQERPVTVYRIIAADTIEERIIELHRQKRELAESLLEGADVPASVTPEQLIQLLRETTG